MIELSIVMPCLNEELTVGTCIEKAQSFLTSSGVSGEIVIADNGSIDDSVKIAKSLGARVVNVKERGYGSALRHGIAAAKGQFVIMGDADDSYDFLALQVFIDALRAGNDLVMGNRFRGGIEPGAMPMLHKYLGNPVLSFIGRLFFKSKIGDFHCGLRGFNRDKIIGLDLNASGMEFASEMIVKASLANLNIAEVPTILHPDGRDRAPHINTWQDGWRHLRFLLLFSPRWMFFYPGAAAFVIGLILSLLLTLQPISLGEVILDIQTLLYTSGMTIVGLQMLFFAIIVQSIGTSFGRLPANLALTELMQKFTLERGILIGGIMIIAGGLWTVSAFLQWQDVSFAELDPRIAMRQTIPAVSLVIMGAQTVTSFFVIGAINALRPGANSNVSENAPSDND
jgi:glycosyltransferase involved in cell wall biosynthesis